MLRATIGLPLDGEPAPAVEHPFYRPPHPALGVPVGEPGALLLVSVPRTDAPPTGSEHPAFRKPAVWG